MYLLGILLTGILGSLVVWYIGCCNCNESTCKTKGNTASTTAVAKTTHYPLSLKDSNGGLNYVSQDNFNFHQNDDQIILPVAAGVAGAVTKIKNYIHGDEKQEIDIIGLYKTTEENNTAFPNLGIARANSVKNYLVSKGIDSKNINLRSKLDNDMQPEGGIYHGPVLFKPHTLSDAELASEKEELLHIHDHIVKDPLLLHFDFASNKLKFTDKQRSKMSEIITYMDKNHSATMDVIGHTDNVGDAAANTRLGLQRANFIKDYLVKLGVSSAQIKAFSKGPNKPIATNDTAEGRAENRRVEIILE